MFETPTPTQALPVLALPFSHGFQLYADLAGMVGEHRAFAALRQCVEACNRFDKSAFSTAAYIYNSAYINPDSIDGVDVTVTGLVVEILKVMREYQCFPLAEVTQPWELIAVRAAKLLIRPPTIDVANAHHLLQMHLPQNLGSCNNRF